MGNGVGVKLGAGFVKRRIAQGTGCPQVPQGGMAGRKSPPAVRAGGGCSKGVRWFGSRSGSVAVDGDTAVDGVEFEGGAAVTEIAVEVIVLHALGGGEVDGEAAIDRAEDEVSGVGGWSFDIDAAIGGLRRESVALPGVSAEADADASVDGAGVDISGQIVEG